MNPTPFSLLLLLLLVCCICAYIMVYSFLLFLCFSFSLFYFPLFSLMMRIMEMDETELDVGGIMMPRGKCTIWLLCMIN
jgi:hypothetical protein